MDSQASPLVKIFSQLYVNMYDFVLTYTDVLILMLLGFVLAMWIIPEHREASPEGNWESPDSETNESEQDYNFLATHESIPSQFDLAIALAGMGKAEDALLILKKLSALPHSPTRERALKLIETVQMNAQARNQT